MVLAPLEPTTSMKCIRQILLVFNATFTFTGFVLISVGSMVTNIDTPYAEFIETRFFSLSILIVGIGFLVFIIALFGCYGAYKLSVAAITLFCFMLISVLILELGIGLIGYTMQDQIEDILLTSLNKTLADYNTDSLAANAIDDLQYELYCCGIQGPDDWIGIMESPQLESVLPASCCAFYIHENCASIYQVGCLSQLKLLISKISLLLVSTVFMIAIMQFLGVIFAYKLARELRQQKLLRDRLWEVKENVVNNNAANNKTLQIDYFQLPSYSELFSRNANEMKEKN